MTLKQIPLVGGKGPTGDPGDPGPAGKGWGWSYKPGWWYGPFGLKEATTSGLVSGDSVYVHFFFVAQRRRFDRMSFSIGQQSQSNAKLAIYNDAGGECYPGGKILETAAIATNLPQTHEIAVNITLENGMYWLAYHASSTNNVQAFEQDSGAPCLGAPGLPTFATGGGGFIGGYSLSRLYSLGFPTSFPTDAVPRIGLLPKILMRAAA